MAWTIAHRVDYAFELEWIEGGILQQVVRVREGLSPYGPPSMEYVSALYAPLYYYISAAFSFLFGLGLPALRLVSVLATLLTCSFIAGTVWQISRSKLGALLGFLAWGSMFAPTEYWFDLARVDSLWVCFLGAAVFFLVSYCQNPCRWLFLVVAICFSCAVLTKQASLFVAPFFFLTAWLWAGWRFALLQALFCGVLVCTAGLFFQWSSDGWFYYFTMQMATHHGMNPSMWKLFLFGDTVWKAFIFAVFSLFFVLKASADRSIRVGWGVLLGGFTFMSLLSRIYPGGYYNVLMPYYLLLTIMSVSWFALYIGKIAKGQKNISVFFVSLLLSFNYYHDWTYMLQEYRIPNRKAGGDDVIGEALVKKIAAVPGRVCVTMHGYLGWLAGKGFCSHRFFVMDLLNGGRSDLVEMLKEDARQKLMSGYYQVLVLDSFAEINDLGVNVKDIPYSVTAMEGQPDYPKYGFAPIVNGTKPVFWLEYEDPH